MSNETYVALKEKDLLADWENLRHDVELQDILNTTRPSGVEFAHKAERAIFEYMLELGISKIYTWDDYTSNRTMARWEWHYGAVRPEGHACVERDFSHLVTMSDGEFEQLVRSAHNKSPNENLVREWRKKMRSLGGLGSVSGCNHGFDAHATKAPFHVPQFNHMPDLYPVDDE